MKLNISPTEGMEPASKLMPQNILRTAPPQVKSNSEEGQIFGEEKRKSRPQFAKVDFAFAALWSTKTTSFQVATFYSGKIVGFLISLRFCERLSSRAE